MQEIKSHLQQLKGNKLNTKQLRGCLNCIMYIRTGRTLKNIQICKILTTSCQQDFLVSAFHTQRHTETHPHTHSHTQGSFKRIHLTALCLSYTLFCLYVSSSSEDAFLQEDTARLYKAALLLPPFSHLSFLAQRYARGQRFILAQSYLKLLKSVLKF